MGDTQSVGDSAEFAGITGINGRAKGFQVDKKRNNRCYQSIDIYRLRANHKSIIRPNSQNSKSIIKKMGFSEKKSP
jgi:hypothetical protein